MVDFEFKSEYDISGEEYTRLLNCCFKYSFCVMLWFGDEKLPEGYEKFIVDLPESVSTEGFGGFTCCFRACKELKELMIQTADHIFAWCNHSGSHCPEDPTFFREDGSLFFASAIHEGFCWLIPRDDENVEEIIQNPLWRVATFETADRYSRTDRHYRIWDKNQIEYLIESAAVSDDEQYIAYIQRGRPQRGIKDVLLICQKPDGETAFTYDLTEQSAVSARIWFENDTVCVKTCHSGDFLRFSLQGELLKKGSKEEGVDAFPGFDGFFESHKTYSGKRYTLKYDGAPFSGFGELDAERSLTVIFPNCDETVLWSANEE